MTDAEIMRLVITGAKEALELVGEWIATGKRPSPKRVREVWATLEQAKAKLDTDAAADARWPDEEKTQP